MIFVLILSITLLGCGGLRRKFVRERKKEKPHPVVYFKDYSKDISYHDLYKKHFLFWKYWGMELIHALEEDNYKKQLTSIQQCISNLRAMESYLVPEKRAFITPYREALEKIEPKIKKGIFSNLERMRIKREIEKLLRISEKELTYGKVSEYIRGNDN